MSEDRLPLYCGHNGVVAMTTWRYDRSSTSSGTFLRVLQRQTELMFESQCEATQQERRSTGGYRVDTVIQ